MQDSRGSFINNIYPLNSNYPKYLGLHIFTIRVESISKYITYVSVYVASRVFI